MPAKTVKPGCQSTCKLMCFTNFPLAMRDKINSELYSLTDTQKSQFYGKYLHQKTKKVEHELKRNRVREYIHFNINFVMIMKLLKSAECFFLFYIEYFCSQDSLLLYENGKK